MNTRRHATRKASILIAIAAIAPTACGGGSDDTIRVTVRDDTALTRTTYAGQFHKEGIPCFSIAFQATNFPRKNVWPYAVEDVPSGLVWEIGISTLSTPGWFAAMICTSGWEPAGHYQGSFTVRVCKDIDCEEEYQLSGAPPFTFDILVTPNDDVSVVIDGITRETVGPLDNPITWYVNSGGTLELLSPVDTEWTWEITSGSPVITVDPGSTPRHWTAVVTGAAEDHFFTMVGNPNDGTPQRVRIPLYVPAP